MEFRARTLEVGTVPKMLLLCCVSLCIFGVFAFTVGDGNTSASIDVGSWRAKFISEIHIPTQTERAGRRRSLLGPGSYPPRCARRCGECTPCRPVHVPVPPGTPVTAEYYPEAWRCKCGSRLYMP